MTIYSLFLFQNSLSFHVQFSLLFPDLCTGFSRGRSGGLVFPSPSEFSTGYLYLEKNMVQKDPCTPMFTATLFTIAKTWKQPKCPLTEEWIKMWYLYTMEYHSAIKKEWNNVICSNMYGPRDCHTEWSKSEREGELSWHHLYVESKKEMIQMISFTKQTHKLREWTYGCQRGRIWIRDS